MPIITQSNFLSFRKRLPYAELRPQRFTLVNVKRELSHRCAGCAERVRRFVHGRGFIHFALTRPSVSATLLQDIYSFGPGAERKKNKVKRKGRKTMIRPSVRGNDMISGVIWRPLLRLFFPVLLGTFFQQLYNTADAMIVGNFVGKEALAAVGGATSVLIGFLVNLFVGISSGTTVVIAQYYGAQNGEDVGRAVHTSMALALAAGVGIMIIGIAFAPWALQAMGTPADILDYAIVYIRIYFTGTIASFIYNMGSGILRAVGDTRRPLYFLIAACLANIALDLLFVVRLGFGVWGVALATVLSQLISAALTLLTLMRADAPYRLTLKKIRFHGELLRGIVRIGLPAGLQSDMYAISNILLQSCINSFGTNTVAAWTAFGKIDGFFWMILGAFGVSITTFAGQNFGARKYERIRRSVKVCLVMSFAATALISVLYCSFGTPLLHLFTDDPAVLELGNRAIFIMAPFYFTFVCVEILSGAIRGTGDSVIPMLLTCGGVCVLRVVWIVFVLPLDRRFEWVAVSYPITWVTTSVLFIVYYLRGGWLRRRIAASGFAADNG